MVVVSDSSVITGLLAINKLSILQILFKKVVLPRSVFQELSALKKFGYKVESLNEPWILVKEAENRQRLSDLEFQLDLGEAESIVLALEVKADYLLIDEKKGRSIAREQGLKIIGLLGILILAKQNGLIPLLKPEIDRLTSKLEFRLHEKLIKAALLAVGE